jgi:chromosome segregation ATPase
MATVSEVELWKNKCQSLENDLATLKLLANKALNDYDELKRQHVLAQKQNDELKKSIISTETKLHDLENLLSHACDEFSQLQEKYDLERKCRSEAEHVASQFYRQNQDFKRQSQLLLDKIDGSTLNVTELVAIFKDEPDGAFHEEREARIKEMQQQIIDLEQKLDTATAEEVNAFEKVNLLKSECKRLREELDVACQTIQDHQAGYDRLQQVCTQACHDYEDLKQKYELELKLKEEAVTFAQKMLGERDAIKRESSVLLASISSEQRLMDALLQIEKLTMQMGADKKEHTDKIRALEEEIQNSGSIRQTAMLEKNLEVMSKELEMCQKSCKLVEARKDKLERENLILIEQLDIARQKLLPPPPPTPPPLPPSLELRPLKIFALKKKSSEVDGAPALARTGKPKDKTYEEALKEMMDRIKRGQTLRPAAQRQNTSPESPESPVGQAPAINELQTILRKFKKTSTTIDSGDCFSSKSS